MKKGKNILLLILLTLMCTGCTIEYNINITDDKIQEVINVTDYISNTRSENDILNHYNNWYPTFVNYIPEGNETIELENFNEKVEGIEYHDKSINKINDIYEYMYKYTYNINEYYDSYAIANAFIEPIVHIDGSSLVLRTGKENLLCQYDYFDSVKINVTIDTDTYKLNYTNTSNIKNNTYTWTLDRSNCDDSQIILTLDRKIKKEESNSNGFEDKMNSKPNDKKLDKYILYIFLGIIALIIYLGYKWFIKFKEKNNNID